MSHVKDMQNHIKSAFKGRHVNTCLSITLSEIFHLHDSKEQGKCILLESAESEENLFKIINTAKKEITLFAIDGCFFKRSNPQERCDSIFFDDSTFCFAELKFDSISENELRIENNRTKAVNQIRSTFKYFNIAFNENFLGFQLEAYVCTPEHYPRKDTALSAFTLEFLEDFGINLFETNEKTFY